MLIWDRQEARPQVECILSELPDGPPIWSPSGTRLLYRAIGGDYEGDLLIVRATGSGAILFSRRIGRPDAAWAPDSGQIACRYVVSQDPKDSLSIRLALLDGRTGESVMDYPLPDGSGGDLRWWAGGDRLAVPNWQEGIAVLNPRTGARLRTLPRVGEWWADLQWSPDGNYIATGSYGESHTPAEINIYHVESGRCRRRGRPYKGFVDQVRFSPDSRHVAFPRLVAPIRLEEKHVVYRIHVTETAQTVLELHTNAQHRWLDSHWTTDGTRFLAVDDDLQVWEWDVSRLLQRSRKR